MWSEAPAAGGKPTAIRVRGLGKRYRIGAAPHRTLREALSAAAGSILRRRPRSEAPWIWALRDVSFDVREGEVVGIIGRNGAGKSTLLKILSRITEPTEGRAEIRGRVGSLLEVGTGFHPELTGRENIYLNGAILGMSRRELERKFDEIVSFAEIGPFLDTPVKRYSSGMYVRLAFAVAAHLEPEILLVDEVLAVGDAAFQRRCLGKMGDVARSGRTVLFVSHNMGAVRRLCSRVIQLESGRVVRDGPAAEVVRSYLDEVVPASGTDEVERQLAALPEDPAVRLTHVEVRQDGRPTSRVSDDAPVEIEIGYVVKQDLTGLRVYFELLDEEGNCLVQSFHDEREERMSSVRPGRYVSCATLPGRLLAPRRYRLCVRASIHNVRTCTGDGVTLALDVEDSGRLNRGYPQDPVRARLRPDVVWRTSVAARVGEP
ncbi:MAG: ATP-binding cassette domain-containing protein [Acidobacteria bacterium]|nr:MAG: ATP-binding cassette domain-containing protein [Acidobacteriota bacterium]